MSAPSRRRRFVVAVPQWEGSKTSQAPGRKPLGPDKERLAAKLHRFQQASPATLSSRPHRRQRIRNVASATIRRHETYHCRCTAGLSRAAAFAAAPKWRFTSEPSHHLAIENEQGASSSRSSAKARH